MVIASKGFFVGLGIASAVLAPLRDRKPFLVIAVWFFVIPAEVMIDSDFVAGSAIEMLGIRALPKEVSVASSFASRPVGSDESLRGLSEGEDAAFLWRQAPWRSAPAGLPLSRC